MGATADTAVKAKKSHIMEEDGRAKWAGVAEEEETTLEAAAAFVWAAD